jgi:hypothetical protein
MDNSVVHVIPFMFSLVYYSTPLYSNLLFSTPFSSGSPLEFILLLSTLSYSILFLSTPSYSIQLQLTLFQSFSTPVFLFSTNLYNNQVWPIDSDMHLSYYYVHSATHGYLLTVLQFTQLDTSAIPLNINTHLPIHSTTLKSTLFYALYLIYSTYSNLLHSTALYSDSIY